MTTYRASGSAMRLHRRQRANLRLRLLVGLGGLAVLVIALVIVQVLRAVPEPALNPESALPVAFPGRAPSLPWPAQGEAVVALAGVGTIGATGGSQPTPIASLTKVMSAIVVLHDHPLSLGHQGPRITVTPADVALFQREQSQGDSVVAVRAGERISEYEALEGALVPSGDNIVRMLARWDAGSVGAFVAKMNATARALGLAHTHYAGPSGVDPASVSTAADQSRLAQFAIANPVLAHIVAKAQVTLPVAGVQYNVNSDLGKNGIVGVKTGWIPAGGASFAFAADARAHARSEIVIGAVVGEQGATPLPTALAAGRHLAAAASTALRAEQIVARGATVGTLRVSYAPPVPAVVTRAVRVVGWSGARIVSSLTVAPTLRVPVARGTRVGTLTVRVGSEQVRVPLVAGAALPQPSLGWRITRL